MALRNAYRARSSRPSNDVIREERDELDSIHSIDGLTRGSRGTTAPGPVNPSTAQNFIADQFDFLQRDSFSPYSRYDSRDEPLDPPTNNNFSFGPPTIVSNDRSFSGTRAQGDGSDTTSSIGLAKDLMSRFQPQDQGRNNPSFVSDNGDKANGIYSLQTDHGIHSNGHRKGPAPSPPPKSTQQKTDRKQRNKRCLIGVIVAIFVLLLAAVAAVLVLHFVYDFFSSSPALNVKYGGEVRFNVTWSKDLEDKSSKAYRDTNAEFSKLMSAVLDNSTHEKSYDVTLNNVYPGSIRCLFSLILGSTDPDIENLIDSGLKTLYFTGATSWYTEETKVQEVATTTPATTTKTTTTTTTTAATTTEATTTTSVWNTDSTTSDDVTTTLLSTAVTTDRTLVFTTPARTTPHPAPTCKPVPEPRCQNLGYDKTGTENPNLFHALDAVVQRSCYTNSLLYACTASYPACQGTVERHPCRQMCQAFRDSCSYPVNCAGNLDDDVDTFCYMSPDAPTSEEIVRNPLPVPCADSEFQCGDGRCVDKSKACDGTDDCGDHSDETGCGDTSSLLDCDFEANNVCGYTNADASDFFWTLQKGPTPSINTGPRTDHTTWTEQGHYLYAEASGQYPYSVTRMLSPEVTLTAETCLRFYYHMLGEQVESLKLYRYYPNNAIDKDVLIWQRSRDQGDVWRFGSVTLPVGTYHVQLEATRGEGYRADIAIDDITAREGKCPDTGCGEDQYQCDNNNCIVQTFVCDSYNDCGDFSDEKHCNCTDEEFQCKFGMCVPEYNRCDGMEQCPDGSDEQNCEGLCSSGRHRCADGTCIMEEWVCDHEADCPDDSDEQNCPTCKGGEFTCRDFGCVNATDICDGQRDCVDGSDEAQCFQTRQQDDIVEVRYDNSWHGLCADSLPSTIESTVCKLMGYSSAFSKATQTITGGAFMKFVSSGNAADNLLSQLVPVDACANDEIISVKCVVPECGRQTVDHHTESYIVNGADALPGQWPWQIGLYYDSRFSCGGSLISHYHVVTAAHCVKFSTDPTKYTVILGATHREPTEDPNRITVNVLHVQSHPGYYMDAIWGDDIAVLTLDKYIDYTDYIKPLCLPNELDYFSSTAQCYVSGWGRTDYYNFSSVPLKLQEAKVKLWSDKKCGQAHINFIDSMTCAGYTSGFISNCPGDSGGPLQCRDHQGVWKLFGVFSFFVRGCNVPLQPPVFTKVQSHLSWIHENTECAFTCDNKRCLGDAALVCDGRDDCGDLTDETRTCSPSVSCTFEDGSYQCGYSASDSATYSTWTRTTRVTTSQNGPITDHTFGNSSGHFMYGGQDRTALVSPIINRITSSCLQINYHMRGNNVGNLKVDRVTVPDDVKHPSKVDLSSSTNLFSISGNKNDMWNSKRIELQSGKFAVMFLGIAGNSLSLAEISLDDVELLDGPCTAQECDMGDVLCDDKCVPVSEQCNFHLTCLNGADETNCNGKQMAYSCDMESYGFCGLEQDLVFLPDHRDWTLLETQDFGNGPQGDHTTGQYGGYVLYLSTLVGTPGQFAGIQLPVKMPQGEHCLTFFYSMISSGSLRVRACSSDSKCEWLWNVRDALVSNWQSVTIEIQTAVDVIQIIGYNGPQATANKGYIALDDISLTNTACVQRDCKPNEFRCSDGSCISFDFTCDGRNDCPDNGDESADTCECLPDRFKCTDGKCIQAFLQCDDQDDCADKSDESSCDQCENADFVCDDGTCKNKYAVCDSALDCPNDEADEPSDCQCSQDQFKCASDGKCIPGFRFCDDHFDCKDGSDEPVYCTKCDQRWSYTCGDGTCIPRDFLCDGTAQCADTSDENPNNCPFVCADKSVVLTLAKFCDGRPDCPQGDDEPVGCECPFGLTACAAGGCILPTQVCDSVYQCKDHSDETGCTCGANTFQCTSGRCIAASDKCDKVVDCDDWTDELQCSASQACSIGEFACANGLCIPTDQQCNRDDNCGDASDELDCVCGAGEMQCAADKRCVPSSWQCDGVKDCSDGEDESQCTTCTANQFQCTDFACIEDAKRCDSKEDCKDGADESYCEQFSNDGLLEAYHTDGWYTVCSTDWNAEWSHQVCWSMGKGPAAKTEEVSVTKTSYLAVDTTGSPDRYSVGILKTSATCASGKGLKITCEELECGLPEPLVSPLIIGGGLAEDSEWPWMASLSYLGGPKCGATLVAPQWAVTAAHCFTSGDLRKVPLKLAPQYFQVTLGTTKQAYPNTETAKNDVNRQVYNVTKIITHPGYSVDFTKEGMLFDDIALIQLDTSVISSNRVRPLCLPKKDQVYNVHTECRTAGWGFINSQSSPASFPPITDLRAGRLRLWTDAECQTSTAWDDNVDVSRQLCAGLTSGAIATCNGDSGGPLMCRSLSGRWDLVGVTSVGSNCGQGPSPARPGVFTRVAKYVDWIEQQMASDAR